VCRAAFRPLAALPPKARNSGQVAPGVNETMTETEWGGSGLRCGVSNAVSDDYDTSPMAHLLKCEHQREQIRSTDGIADEQPIERDCCDLVERLSRGSV